MTREHHTPKKRFRRALVIGKGLEHDDNVGDPDRLYVNTTQMRKITSEKVLGTTVSTVYSSLHYMC